MIPMFETTYSTKQLYDMVEQIDVYDNLKKIAYDKAQQEAKQKK